MPNKKRLFAFINIALIVILAIVAAVWISRGGEDAPVQTEMSFTAEADKSILDQTDEKTDAEIVNAGQGAYVQAMGGLENGDQGGGIWVYYVNGQKTDTVPGDYITKGGELVEWKFEQPAAL